MNAVVRTALIEHVERAHWRAGLAATLPELDALRTRIEQRHGGPLSDSTPLIREDRER